MHHIKFISRISDIADEHCKKKYQATLQALLDHLILLDEQEINATVELLADPQGDQFRTRVKITCENERFTQLLKEKTCEFNGDYKKEQHPADTVLFR